MSEGLLPPVGGGAGDQPLFHLGSRRVRFAGEVGAEEGLALLLASLRALVESAPPEALPEPVLAAVQPPWWTPPAWAARAELADLRGRPLRRAAWRQRWTPSNPRF